MKKIALLLSILFCSSLAFADQGSCKQTAHQAALSLFALGAGVDSTTDLSVTTRLVNSSYDGDKSQWRISFISDDEWAIMYTVETTNYGDKATESCVVDSVKVDRAG